MAVDVDDLSIACNTRLAIEKFKQQLRAKFKIKDMGELRWLLSIEVKRDRATHTIAFSQAAYIERILCCFNLKDANLLSTLMDPHHQLTKAQCPSTPHEYKLM